ncbi:hypothetical protein [Porcipelethomonas sp.]|uniref:hypothetical protein n=1 Tax=Porcipelethomonas sp. TaxID=2981675 RepID=UPI003EF7CAC5
MFSRITGEFDLIEFAEYAARRIRETVDGEKKITIYKNKNKYKNMVRKNNEPILTHGEIFYLLPTAITSYNYITAVISRPVNTSRIEEPLLTRSVKIKVISASENNHMISQILLSFGGYGIHVNEITSNK